MLSDKEYSNLKSDEWIAGCIVMLEDIMSVSKYKRSEHSKDRKKSDIDSINKAVNNLEAVISDQLLSESEDIRKMIPALKTKLKEYKQFQNDFNKIQRRVGHQSDRNFWIESICIRLFNLGLVIQARRVEFIYRLFYDYDFDGIRTAIESEETPDNVLDKFDEANMKRSIRLIDNKATDVYINN